MNHSIARKTVIVATAAFLGLCPLGAAAQQTAEENQPVVIDALFEYPQAPDSLVEITARANWLMEHFWEPMNFQRTSVSQAALNHAFGVYATSMQWAERDKAIGSVDKLLAGMAKNPTLLFQFVKAAEYQLYGPRAIAWSDEAYLPFLNAAIANKKLSKTRKEHFRDQRDRLVATQIEKAPAQFRYQSREGGKMTFVPGGLPTLIMFVQPDCMECRMAKVKMETDPPVRKLVEEGKLRVMHITLAEADDSWLRDTADYPGQWIVGASKEAADKYDLRGNPSFYLLDADGRLMAKNLPLVSALRMAEALVNNSNPE